MALDVKLPEVILPRFLLSISFIAKGPVDVSISLTHGLLLVILFYFVLLNILECIKIAETYVAWAFLVHNLLLPLTSRGWDPGCLLGLAMTRRAPQSSLCPFWLMGEGPDRSQERSHWAAAYRYGLGQMPGSEMGSGPGEPRGSVTGAETPEALNCPTRMEGRRFRTVAQTRAVLGRGQCLKGVGFFRNVSSCR